MYNTTQAFLLLFILNSPTWTAALETTTSLSLVEESKQCEPPPSPEHGTYEVLGNGTSSGLASDPVAFKYSCDPGYQLDTVYNVVVCYKGVWYNEHPKCKRVCHLEHRPDVEYQCLNRDYKKLQSDTLWQEESGHRECEEEEPDGTVVRPHCKSPNFYSPAPLKLMRCVEGVWDYTPICAPECGILPHVGTSLLFDDAYSNPLTLHTIYDNNLPWHAMVYKTTENPYTLACGGSLITNSIIISAAHCFWTETEKKLPATQFAAAVGKLYRDWDSPKDTEAQKSDIRDIIIPSTFQGEAANLQDNIAIVIVNSSFQFSMYIRPVCLDFDHAFDDRQLQIGRFGKLSRWALKDDSKTSSPALEVVAMEYLDPAECQLMNPPLFRELITSDKFCARFYNDTATVRQGYSGSGLVFSEFDRGVQRHYLRGVASAVPAWDPHIHHVIFSITQILKHEHFIKDNIK